MSTHEFTWPTLTVDFSNGNENKPTRKKKYLYRLKKDTFEFNKCTVFIEQCTDGTQDFDVFDPLSADEKEGTVERKYVIDNPEWFEKISIKFEAEKVKKKQPSKKSQKYAWTPERREAHSQRMKEVHARRQGN